jgi:hypothetical protein
MPNWQTPLGFFALAIKKPHGLERHLLNLVHHESQALHRLRRFANDARATVNGLLPEEPLNE